MRLRVSLSSSGGRGTAGVGGRGPIITMDLPCGQIQGFFGAETPCGNLDKLVVALPYLASALCWTQRVW